MALASEATIASSGLFAEWISSARDSYRLYRARNRVYRQTLAELAALSDSDLSDIGICRFAVRDVARAAAMSEVKP